MARDEEDKSKKDKKEDDDLQEEEIMPFTGSVKLNRRMGDSHGSGGMWLVSFTDVMALMLTFFVMLFAMSQPQDETWDDFSTALQSEFNKFYGRVLNRGFQDTVSIDKLDRSQALDLNYLKAIMLSLMEEAPALSGVTLITQPRSLIVSLPEELLFESAQTDVKEEGSKALFALGGALSRIKNRIEVAGHADPRPLAATSQYASNWELSLSRAASVAAVLEDVGYSKPILVRGHSSGRYDDLPDTMSEEQKLGLSRRVDIVIMEDDGRSTKVFDIGRP